MSQEALALKTGISQSVLAKIEKGKLLGRIREQQDVIAEALGMSVQELCGESSSARTGAPRAPVEPEAGWADLGPLDDALGASWDPAQHRVVDLMVVRSMMTAAEESEVLRTQVRALLDAAAKLRMRGRSPTPEAVAMELAKVTAPPSVPSRAAKAAR